MSKQRHIALKRIIVHLIIELNDSKIIDLVLTVTTTNFAKPRVTASQ